MKDTRRSINAKFWTDPDVEDFSEGATHLFLDLMTFPENNMAGVFEISDKKLCMYTKWPIEKVGAAMNELCQKNKVMRSGSWVCIRNHIKNQKMNNNMMMAAIKDLCPAPIPVKVWLLSKLDSSGIVDWFDEAVFSVNAYYSEQRNRIAKKYSNGGKDKDALQAAYSELPIISVSREDLLKILTNPLPFKPDELSKYNYMVTLTQGLGNLMVNMKIEDRSMKDENRNMKNEEGRMKDEWNTGDAGEVQINSIFSPKFESFPGSSPKKPVIDQVIEHWNSKEDLPKTRKLTFNLGEKARPLNEVLKLYTVEESKKAIDNYCTVKSDPDTYDQFISYGDVFGFIERGIEKFCDDSKPFEVYKRNFPSFGSEKKESNAEIVRREIRERDERLAREKLEKQGAQKV